MSRLFLALLLAGCGKAVLVPGTTARLVVADERLAVAVQEAQARWETRLAHVFSGDDATPHITVVVGALAAGHGAEYMFAGARAWTVVVNAIQVDRPELPCFVEHELGHALGLEHVSHDGPDLMAAYLNWDGTGCRWSERDDEEAERVGWHLHRITP